MGDYCRNTVFYTACYIISDRALIFREILEGRLLDTERLLDIFFMKNR